MIFLDTSAVIAYYLPETYSRQVQTHFAGNLQPIISSLVEVEVLSVFSRLVRTQSLTLDAAKQVADIFTTHLE